MLYVQPISSSLIWSLKKIWWTVQIMKLSIMQFYLPSVTLPLSYVKIFSPAFALSISLLQNYYKYKFHTTIKNVVASFHKKWHLLHDCQSPTIFPKSLCFDKQTEYGMRWGNTDFMKKCATYRVIQNQCFHLYYYILPSSSETSDFWKA
jgi:hypothetical protein